MPTCAGASLIESGKSIVRPGTKGAEIVDALKPDGPRRWMPTRCWRAKRKLGAREWALYKPRWSAFYGTRLDALLRQTGCEYAGVRGLQFPQLPAQHHL